MSLSTPQGNKTETPPWAAGTDGRHDELYPRLTAAETEIVRGYGRERSFADGDTVWSYGERYVGLHLVLAGRLDIVRGDRDGNEALIVSHGAGAYSGETVSIASGGALVAGRAAGALTTIHVTAPEVRRLIATEADLGEKVLLSFILRRMRIIAENLGNVTLIGHGDDLAAQRLRSFCSRNALPFEFLDPATAPRESSRLLAERGVSGEPLPILVHDEQVLVTPTIREVAEAFGFTAAIDADTPFDVAVVGGGPAGLAAAVYAASEGLKVVVVEGIAPGGQAGSSSKIENYLGFPTGISGQALAGRAYLQAQKFGANMAMARQAEGLTPGEPYHSLTLDGGDVLQARAVVIATGAVYRRPPIPELSRFAGVHYGASHVEGEICRGRDVAVIGGGNSAGQAAVYLSRRARRVHVLVRGPGLGHSMSDYLIRRIDQIGNIELHTHREVARILGDGGRIDGLELLHNDTGQHGRLAVSQLFIFIGAVPGTGFVEGQVALNDRGFVLTGDQLNEQQLAASGWPLRRRPYLLESSVPRIFCAGDVRCDSIKRVASAVGEGSVCIQFIHKVLSGERAA